MEQQVPSTQKRFNYRSFVATGLTLTVCILPVSGFMVHRLQFSAMTPERHFWMSSHSMTGVIFVILMLVHLALNRRALGMYISARGGHRLNKELLAAVVSVVVPLIVFALHAFHVHGD